MTTKRKTKAKSPAANLPLELRQIAEIVAFVIVYLDRRQLLNGDNKAAAKMTMHTLTAVSEALDLMGPELAARWKELK